MKRKPILKDFFRKALILLPSFILGVSAISQTTFTVGTGSASSSNTPINTYYGYSYTQTILTSSEINAIPGEISAIRFYLNSGSLNNSDNWDVYLSNTSASSFSGLNSWIPSNQFTQVFSGTVTGTSGNWVTITLSTPFQYFGGNLAVAVDENQGGYGSSSSWAHTSTSSAQTIYSYSDPNNINPTSPPNSSGYPVYAGTANTHANVQLDITPFPLCSGMPTPDSTFAEDTIVCANALGNNLLTLENSMLNVSGIGYQWQMNDGSGWQDIVGDTSWTLSLNGAPDTTTQFRCKVKCTATNDSTESTPVTVHVIDLPIISSNIYETGICNGDTVNLSFMGADTFTWSTAPISLGAMGSSGNVSPSTFTNYQIEGTDTATGCASKMNIEISPIEFIHLSASGASCSSTAPVTITANTNIQNLNGGSWEYQWLLDTGAAGSIIQSWNASNTYSFTPTTDTDTSFYVWARNTACTDTFIATKVNVTIGFGAGAEIQEINCTSNQGSIELINYFGQKSSNTWFTSDFSTPLQPVLTQVFGDAQIANGRMQVTPSASSKTGGFSIENVNNVAAINNGFEIEFLLTADQPINTYGTGGGDGIAYSFGDNAVYLPGQDACAGFGDKLRISFDAANNGNVNNAAGVYVAYGYTGANQLSTTATTTLAYVNNIADWKTKTDVMVKISIDLLGKLTMSIDGNEIFSNVQLPESFVAADKSTWKHLFSAHTGGDALRQAVDNVNITYNALDFGITQGNGNNNEPNTWQSSPMFDSLSIGTYNLWIGNPNDSTCNKMVGTYTLEYNSPQVNLGSDTVFCIGNSITLDATNADTNFTYLWNDGSTNSTLTIDSSNTYWVLITDTLGCTAYDQVNVSVSNDIPTVDLGSDTTHCGPIELTVTNTNVDYFWSTGATNNSTTISQTGTYFITVTNASGCEGSDAIDVTINELPVIGSVSASGFGETFTFVANNSTFVDSYTWNYGDGNSDNTVSNQTTYVYPSGGTYEVEVIASNLNGCPSDTHTVEVYVTPLGIEDENAFSSLEVYPNPASNLLNLRTGGSENILDVEVYSVSGTIVLSTIDLNTQTTSLDISRLSAGVYMVKVQSNSQSYLQKLLVK